MVYTSLPTPYWCCLATLMLIGVEIQLIVDLQLDIVSSWVILLSLGVAKSKLLLLALVPNMTSELIWLRWLLTDISVSHSFATMLYCDNNSAIHISHNDVFHEFTKYIEIDCHFVRHHVSHGTIRLVSVSSKQQTTDIFTKTLFLGRFQDLLRKLKMASTISS